MRRERALCLGVFIAMILFLGTYQAGVLNRGEGQMESFESQHPSDDIPDQEPPRPPRPPPLRPPSHKSPPSADQDAHNDARPVTTMPTEEHADGFTILDHLYLRSGTFYVLTSDSSKFPRKRNMLSRPLEMGSPDMEPTDKELQFLSPVEAQRVLGDHAMRISDTTVIVYDPPQFLHHFYHWWGEIIMGVWRIFSALEPTISGAHKAEPTLPIARFFMPFSKRGEWRDNAGVNGPLMRAAFPRASIEESDYWQDLIKLNTTVVFERVMLVNRHAAHQHPLSNKWHKMIAGTMNVTAPDNFWAPVRQSLVQNILGSIPDVEGHDEAEGSRGDIPVLTYISRQGSGLRRLRNEDHEGLLAALAELEAEGLCKVETPEMELLSVSEQINLAARSTIILGVHGNGLTHQLWMPRSPRSTIFEIFDPEGYIFDYELLARNLGHQHYAVWNDTFVTYPPGTYHEVFKIGERFHGTSIPVDGPSVANAIKKRLAKHQPKRP